MRLALIISSSCTKPCLDILLIMLHEQCTSHPNLGSEEHQKSKMGITMFRKQLDNSMMLHENSKVYGDIAAKCLEDCEVGIHTSTYIIHNTMELQRFGTS